jgi:hypothetical protein
VNGGLDLFHGRLYDAGEGFQLGQGVLRSAASVECVVEPLKRRQYMGACMRTHLAGQGEASDVFRDKGLGSREGDIVNDERRVMSKPELRRVGYLWYT